MSVVFLIAFPVTLSAVTRRLVLRRKGTEWLIAITYGASRYANLEYRASALSVLIGSISHFEVAITVAITLFGFGSGAALATVIGHLMEVPLMLSLARLLWRIKGKFPRKRNILSYQARCRETPFIL